MAITGERAKTTAVRFSLITLSGVTYIARSSSEAFNPLNSISAVSVAVLNCSPFKLFFHRDQVPPFKSKYSLIGACCCYRILKVGNQWEDSNQLPVAFMAPPCPMRLAFPCHVPSFESFSTKCHFTFYKLERLSFVDVFQNTSTSHTNHSISRPVWCHELPKSVSKI
jgi:hypothetical protein